MHQPTISKRLARARWGEIRQITPHEKKEKNFGGAKIMSLSQNPASAASAVGCNTRRCSKPEF
jgi:hypothetical protein